MIPSPQERKPDLGLKTVASKASEIPYPEGFKPNSWKFMETAEIQYPQGLKQEVGLETESKTQIPYPECLTPNYGLEARRTSLSPKASQADATHKCLQMRLLMFSRVLCNLLYLVLGPLFHQSLDVKLYPFLIVENNSIICPIK